MIETVINEGMFFNKMSVTHARISGEQKTVCGCTITKYYQPGKYQPDCKKCLKKLHHNKGVAEK